MGHHQRQIDKAYIEGFKNAEAVCETRREKDRSSYYEEGVRDGRIHEAEKCEAAKRLVFEQSYAEGKAEGESQVTKHYEGQLEALKQSFEDRIDAMETDFEFLLMDTLNRLRIQHEANLQAARAETIAASANNPKKMNASAYNLAWGRTIATLCLILAAPFLAAAVQRGLCDRRMRK